MSLVVYSTTTYMTAPEKKNFTFSLSKPLSLLTADEVLSADCWVGFRSLANNQMAEGNISTGLAENNPDHCWCWATDPSALYSGDWSTAHWSYPANFPDGIYMRNILVECDYNNYQNVSLLNNSDARIVIEITPQEEAHIQDLYVDNSSYIVNGFNNENRVTDYRHIKPAVLMVVNDTLYVWIQGTYPKYDRFYCDSTTAQGYVTNAAYFNFNQTPNHYLGMGWTRALNYGDMYTDSGSTTAANLNYDILNTDFGGIKATLNVSCGATNYHKRASVNVTDNADKEVRKWYTASTGFPFKVDNVWYKPIVQGGVVVGYTDDMSVPSEWDNWTGVKNHNVPGKNPGWSNDDADDDTRERSHYGTYGGGAGAFARCWACNQTTLNDLWLWMGETADPEATPPVYGPPEGFNPVNSIIGLLQFPVNLPHTTNKTSIVFWDAMAEGDRTVNTHVGAEGREACYLISGGTFEIDLGSVKVEQYHLNDWNYLDYDEAIELYIPYCGVFTIDTHSVMGRTITARMWVDPIAGTCTFIATCDNVDVAMGSGSMAVSMPVTVNQYSMTMASINNNKSARTNALISAGASMAIQAIGNAVPGAISGRSNMIGNLVQTYGWDDMPGNATSLVRGAGLRGGLSGASGAINNAFNAGFVQNAINSILNTRRANKMLSSSNNTAVCGSFGGSQDTWRLPQHAYIKVVRYLTKIPSNHVEAVGKIFLQETTLSDCSGYTTVANPNLSSLTGFLTAGELTELYGILCNGIYAGGGAS